MGKKKQDIYPAFKKTVAWFASGGASVIAAAIGIVRGWPASATVCFAFGVFLLTMAYFINKGDKWNAENHPPGFRMEAAGLLVPPGGEFLVPTTAFLVDHAQEKVIPLPNGATGVRKVRVIGPRKSRAISVEDFPKKVYLGFIPPFWPRYVEFKIVSPDGIAVVGCRTNHLGIELEVYP